MENDMIKQLLQRVMNNQTDIINHILNEHRTVEETKAILKEHEEIKKEFDRIEGGMKNG